MLSLPKPNVLFSFFLILLILSTSLPPSSKSEPKNEINKEVANPIKTPSIHTRILSDIIIVNVVLPSPTIKSASSYDIVEIGDLPSYGAPGHPILPFKTLMVWIPPHKEIESFSVIAGEKKSLEGKFNVEYGKTPIHISSKKSFKDMPDPKIYHSSNPFPGILFSTATEQYLRGHKIFSLRLYPVHYVPLIGKLLYYDSISVVIKTRDVAKTHPFLRNSPQDISVVQGVVDNPHDVEAYYQMLVKQPTRVDTLSSYQYVIITNRDLNSSFQPLIESKILKGLNATTVLVEDILNDPDYFSNGVFGDGTGTLLFNDTAARIRNFIKDAYLNWGTEYVLLGGDTEIIPPRGVCAYEYTGGLPPWEIDCNIPCDMYYGTLDGSWNNDNDTKFGEGVIKEDEPIECNGTAGEEADFFAEVYIGRAPVETPEEAANFVNKTLWYAQVTDDRYLASALMIGETLDEQTEGGNGKDLITDIIPQYTTTRLYDRDGTFSKAAVINNLNQGPHIVNHDGHANKDVVMGLSTTDVDNLINDKYFFIYSLGCYSAAFDIGASGSEAIAEHFIFNKNGSFAYVGNTRYGWYIPGTTYGPGDTYDRSFFSVLMGGSAKNLGKVLQLSKENLYSSSLHRWTYFNLVLFGDPEVELVTELKLPTAHFQTEPSASRLEPAVLKGVVNLTGIAKRGSAIGATFKNFTVQFGLGVNPSSWSTHGIDLINGGLSEIEDDVLAIWNTSQVTPFQTYTLRLIVYDENGEVGEDRWVVQVKPLPTLQANPPLTEIRVGQKFTVNFEITFVEQLYELEIQFAWDATLVDYVNHTLKIPVENYSQGILYSPVQILKNEVNTTSGTYFIAAKSKSPAPSFDGNGTVFEMTFEAKEAGVCILNISSSKILDKRGKNIAHYVVNGVADIAPGIHDVAVIDVYVSRTVVCQGLNVDIKVTVENKGSFNEIFHVITYANETAINTTQISLPYYSIAMFSFSWNTNEVPLGEYNISVIADPLPGETNISDNVYVAGIITIIEPVFDIAVIGINISKRIVGEGYVTIINVTVENQADLPSTFNISIFADFNRTIVGDEILIGIKEVFLTGQNFTVVTFIWNTTGVTKGNYTISAYVEPLEAEGDLGDNLYIDDILSVTIPGDVDGDFWVSLYDAVKLLARYGAREGDPEYHPVYDIDNDGRIFLYDAVILLGRYGQRYP